MSNVTVDLLWLKSKPVPASSMICAGGSNGIMQSQMKNHR